MPPTRRRACAIIRGVKAPVVLDSPFRLSDEQARVLAATYGTPLYVLNEGAIRARLRAFAECAREAYPKTECSFASKANSTLAVLAIVHQEGWNVDVASEGELRAAMRAGVPPARCHLHGNNKSSEELAYALGVGVGQVILDHLGEIETVAQLRQADAVLRGLDAAPESPTRYLLRLAPGVDPVTHFRISTGQADTKFGFNIADGSAERALLRCLELGVPVIGFHCHVGSQLTDPEAQRSGAEILAQFAVAMRDRHGFRAEVINVGGGLGVRYTDQDRPVSFADYCRLIGDALRTQIEGSDLDPTLGHEPGRCIVAEAGVTVYTVGAIKTVPIGDGKTRTYVCVNGGLADNPRPALYGSRYTVVAIAGDPGRQLAASERITCRVSGRHCETDTLFDDVALPSALQSGDLVQVLCTGAYNASMASNYNRYPRPATALLREDGTQVLVQRPETWDELFAREIMPEEWAE